MLFVDYNQSEQAEVLAILESISTCLFTQKATIIYTGPLFVDGCEYIITINNEDYKATNQEVIHDVFLKLFESLFLLPLHIVCAWFGATLFFTYLF